MVDTTGDFQEFYAHVRRSFFNFIKACGINNLTWQQYELAARIEQKGPDGDGGDRIAIRSGQGPGKTFMSSLVGLWRAIQNENGKVVVTAPTMAQCKDVWLAQARKHIQSPKAHPYLNLMYEFTGTGFGCFGRHQTNWGCLLKTATNPDNIRGQHEENMDIIVEEASGCDDDVLTILRGTQSNQGGLFFMIGNPSKREGMFYDAFNREGDKWWKRRWNAEDIPASKWFNPGRNRDMEEKFGRDSDFYRVNVLGDFPQADPDSMIPEEWLVECMDSVSIDDMLLRRNSNGGIIKQIGIDFARFGSDESVAMYRQGNALLDTNTYSHREPLDVVDNTFLQQSRMGWRDTDTTYVPDATGMGQGVLGQFYRYGKSVHEFHAGAIPCNPQMHDNKVTESWYSIREMVRQKQIYIPSDDTILYRQLVTRKYDMTLKGQMYIEPKDIYKKRGYDSPDRADALVMTFYPHAIVDAQVA